MDDLGYLFCYTMYRVKDDQEKGTTTVKLFQQDLIYKNVNRTVSIRSFHLIIK